MIQLCDREISHEQLVLDSKTELYYLGHNLTLRNCTLVLKVPAKSLVIARTRFIDCTIEAHRELKNLGWDSAHLKGCRFRGRFFSNDFGNWRGTLEASIEACDFTEADLDMTRFLSCDAFTLRFPPWPCFTILDPVRRWRELRQAPWPGDIGPILIDGYAERPTSTAAVTYSAPALAKRSGATPEAIKAVLEKLDGVQY